MFKRIMSVVISAATIAGFIPHIPAKAEESGSQPYPYTLFASSSEDGAITVNAGNFCVNGNVATNGTIVSSGNININGTRTEQATESMIYILDKIDTRYFSGSNIDEHEDDYSLEELNINISNPTEVHGEATLTGNININSALKALEDVNLYGEVKNTNDSVIFSKYGDIVIDSQNVNLNGLVYAPFGNVTVNAQNLNLNNVVIIAQSIVLTCPNVNANNSSSMSSFVGSESELLDIPYDEWEYMKDENKNGFPDFFEDSNNWSLLKDLDGDKLPDCVEVFIGSEPTNVDTDNDGIDDYYEVFVLFTDPTLEDSDENGISDYDEDFDEDLLINGQEYLLKTDPWNNDSDYDDISDGDEVNMHHTDPMNKDTDNDKLEDSDEFLFNTDPNNPDTNGNGILDGDEKFPQTFTYTVNNEDCAVEEVIVSMNGTGNIQKNTSVESIMNKDMICSDVVGLVGDPFEIETESKFDNATLSFKINRSKLGDTDFNDLMFLWYDEENYEFVELETFYDDTNSIVSINTTHFSRYMVVDKNKWFEAWTQTFNYNPAKNGAYGAPTYKYNTVMAIDCSGSMESYDQIKTNNVSSFSDSLYHAKTCHRIEAAESFVYNMNSVDKAAIVLFTNTASIEAQMTDNANELFLAAQKITNSGGTSFYAALTKSYDAFEESSLYSNNTYNRIILLSDGQDGDYSATIQLLNSIYGKNSTDKRKSIKIYTIGLGTSYDSNLKEIARISGGEFIEAYTAEELVDIYANNGFDSDFDTTDTDGDGLYDAVEAAGIRIQNGQVIRGCDPTKKDTDNDGLADGQEIDPTIHTYENSIFSSIFKKLKIKPYYFVMKSNPVNNDDTDDDGYSDIEDPNPLEKPDYLGDKYDFLDGEIYEIKALDSYPVKYIDVKSASTEAGTPVIMYGHNGDDNQRFKFEWCGNGYKIHSLINERLVLTMSLDSSGEGKLYMDYDNNNLEQIWEILPYHTLNPDKECYTNWITGVVIRSKMLYYKNTEAIGEPLYINQSDGRIWVSSDRRNDTRFDLKDISGWKRFGKIYMNYEIGANNIPTEDTFRALKNYKHNTTELNKILTNDPNYYNLKNPTSYMKTGCINGQKNFSILKFADTSFGGVGCEVLATYNAMTRSNITVDLCKLIAEFEINALLITGPLADGKAGSIPDKISNCLEAYLLNPDCTDSFVIPLNRDDVYDSYQHNKLINKIQNELDGKGKIIFSAWNYVDGRGVDIINGLHTVYIEKDTNAIIIYNNDNYSTKPNRDYCSIAELFEKHRFRSVVIGIWW